MVRLIQLTLFLFISSITNADLLCTQNVYGGCDDRGCGGRCQRVGLGDCVCGSLGFGTYLPSQPIVPAAATSALGSLGCISNGVGTCINNGGCNGQCASVANICQCRINSFNGYVNQAIGYRTSGTLGCVSQGFNGCVNEGCLGRCANAGIPPNNICYCEYGYGNGYGLGKK